MRNLLKEPVLQFLAIGFIAYAGSFLLGNEKSNFKINEPPVSSDVFVSISQIENLKKRVRYQLAERGIVLDDSSEEFSRALDLAVNQYVNDELFYREAQKQGLLKGDPEIRKHLIEKYQSLEVERSSLPAVTNDDIVHYYQTHPTQFTEPKRIDIWQVFFDKSVRPGSYVSDCQSAANRVKNDPAVSLIEIANLADRTALYRQDMRFIDQDKLAEMLSSKTASEIFKRDTPGWLGAVESGNGCHLIKLLAIHPKRLRPLDNIRFEILQKLERQRREKASRRLLDQLKQSYTIEFESGIDRAH